MTNEERIVLLNGIKSYYLEVDDNYLPLLINPYKKGIDDALCPLFLKVKDNKYGKKILIENNYGTLGILLYKYSNEISNDEEILLEMTIKDIHYFTLKFNAPHNCNLSIGYILNFVLEDIKNILLNDKKWLLRLLTCMRTSFGECLVHYRDFEWDCKSDIDKLFSCINQDFRNDRPFMIEAIRRNPMLIGWASDNLKNDEYLALMAIRQNRNAFELIGDKLKNDTNFFIKAYLINHNINIHYSFMENIDFVEQLLTAIKKADLVYYWTMFLKLLEKVMKKKQVIMLFVVIMLLVVGI